MSSPVPAPERVSQATTIEMSRAVAEVQAAVLMARQFPRDQQRARREMEDTCAQTELAEEAFWRFRRGDSQINGETIHLARELARCWGNMQWGVYELARNDNAGESEMLAYAWDIQGNSRSSMGFIVPHKRDKDGRTTDLKTMRDIYENNANLGARRVRECIFAVLPRWYRQRAVALCRETLENGGGRALAVRVAEVLDWYKQIGVRESALIRKLDGTATDQWDAVDIANLGVIYRSIQRGETTIDVEFPRQVVQEEELAGSRRAVPAAPTEPSEPVSPTPTADAPTEPRDAGEQPAAEKRVEPVQRGQLTALRRFLSQHQIEDTYALRLFTALVRRPIAKFTDLTAAEATALQERLDGIAQHAGASPEDVVLAIDSVLTHEEEQQQ